MRPGAGERLITRVSARRRARFCFASLPPTMGGTTAWMSSLAATCPPASCRSTPGECAVGPGPGTGGAEPCSGRAPESCPEWVSTWSGAPLPGGDGRCLKQELWKTCRGGRCARYWLPTPKLGAVRLPVIEACNKRLMYGLSSVITTNLFNTGVLL